MIITLHMGPQRVWHIAILLRRRSWLKQQPGDKTIRKKLIRWCGCCGLIGSTLITTVLISS